MSVLIVDYGINNLHSVTRAFQVCGAEIVVSDNPSAVETATHIVIPGVGAFGEGMEALISGGWSEPLRKASLQDKIPTIGICLGMHLLANKSFEWGEIEGLGLIRGEVKRLSPETADERVPHVGWNEIHSKRTNPLFQDIPDGIDFYFVHSYHMVPANQNHVIAVTPYCGEFAAAVMSENIFGVQFHPEKSSRSGMQLLRNFLQL